MYTYLLIYIHIYVHVPSHQQGLLLTPQPCVSRAASRYGVRESVCQQLEINYVNIYIYNDGQPVATAFVRAFVTPFVRAFVISYKLC